MRLLIIRHGDPEEEIDALNEKGKREVELLADALEKERIDAFYVSPYTRARETADAVLKRFGVEPVICDYLHEFDYPTYNKDGSRRSVAWDLLPSDWTLDDRYFSADNWADTELMKSGDIRTKADYVTDNFDACLASHGYKREGRLYRTEKGNDKTIAFFCHLGLECVLLGHLLGISPVILWHGTAPLPSSVTTLYTEEREKGYAFFRMTSFGDLSHLKIAGEPAAFSGRFCEVYESGERH